MLQVGHNQFIYPTTHLQQPQPVQGSGQVFKVPKPLLDAAFQLQEDPYSFFEEGKVFRVLWAEPAGFDMSKGQGRKAKKSTTQAKAPSTTPGNFGELVYHGVKLFIVIERRESYSLALKINSYGGRGVAKFGTVKDEHAIIYTGKEAPQPLPEEIPPLGQPALRTPSILVDADCTGKPNRSLTQPSRLSFGKIYTIEHNIRTQSFGKVNKDSMPHVYRLFGQVHKAAQWNIHYNTCPRQLSLMSLVDAARLNRSKLHCPGIPIYKIISGTGTGAKVEQSDSGK